jgi:hypothetical protein
MGIASPCGLAMTKKEVLAMTKKEGLAMTKKEGSPRNDKIVWHSENFLGKLHLKIFLLKFKNILYYLESTEYSELKLSKQPA